MNDNREAGLKAEVERLREELAKWDHNGGRVGCNHEGGICCRFDGYKRRAESAEAALTSEREAHAGLRARLEALADEWEQNAYRCTKAGDCPVCVTYQGVVIGLRRALAAGPAEATASRPPETSGAGSLAPVAAEEGGEQEAGEVRPILCGSNGGRYSLFGHQCSCNRQAGHPLDSPRPHGCSCGAPWSCEDCADADPYMGCAGCGAVGSPGDDQSIYVTRRPAPSGSDERGNRPATPDANGVHDTEGGEGQPTGHDKAVEWMSARLIEEGAGVGNSFHGWRCEYPDIYGGCDCVAESARDLLAALRAALATGDPDVAEALGLRADRAEWGVRFADGSVRHVWNGRTARHRAEKSAAFLRERYAPDRIVLVRRSTLHTDWTEA